MKRVLIIGCPGGGKSTFARALREKTGLPIYHLDMMYWNPDRTKVPKVQFRQALDAVLAAPEWIIDGNYMSTMEERLAHCDTVFFLDYPTEVCLAGRAARMGKARADMPWYETPEDPEDRAFLDFIRNYQTDSRPIVMEHLVNCRGKEIHIFHDRNEADDYLNQL